MSTALDPFLSLRTLAAYSGLSVRTWRSHLTDPSHPLPAYRVGGRLLVRVSEFDSWIQGHRAQREPLLRQTVAAMLERLREKT